MAGGQHAARLALEWALALLMCVAACSSPATTTRDARAVGAEPPPRFAMGGPDAEEFGASEGYPKGDRATYDQVPYLVGSHSLRGASSNAASGYP